MIGIGWAGGSSSKAAASVAAEEVLETRSHRGRACYKDEGRRQPRCGSSPTPPWQRKSSRTQVPLSATAAPARASVTVTSVFKSSACAGCTTGLCSEIFCRHSSSQSGTWWVRHGVCQDVVVSYRHYSFLGGGCDAKFFLSFWCFMLRITGQGNGRDKVAAPCGLLALARCQATIVKLSLLQGTVFCVICSWFHACTAAGLCSEPVGTYGSTG